MSWFYVREHTILGPLPAALFHDLVRQGEINGDTLVWREGTSNWTPWSAFQSESGKTWTPEEFAQQDLTTPLGPLWDAAWAWFRREPWPLVGQVTLSAGLIGLAWGLGMVFSLLIPVVGSLAGFLVLGPLQTGSLLMVLERRRGQTLSLKTIFRAFGPRYPQLLIAQAVQGAVLLVVGLPALGGFAVLLALVAALNFNPSVLPLWMTPELSLVVVLVASGLSLAGMCAYFYLAIAWLYAPLLILDKGLDFWPAMQLSRRVAYRHPWGFSWFLFVTSTLALMGLLGMGVGVLFTLTLSLMLLVLAYERQYSGLRLPGNQARLGLISPTDPTGTATPSQEDPASNPLPRD